jgi:hypothetical protein
VDQRDLVIRAKEGDHDAFTSLGASSIARLDADASGKIAIIDARTGKSRTDGWQSAAGPTWQRVLP